MDLCLLSGTVLGLHFTNTAGSGNRKPSFLDYAYDRQEWLSRRAVHITGGGLVRFRNQNIISDNHRSQKFDGILMILHERRVEGEF